VHNINLSRGPYLGVKVRVHKRNECLCHRAAVKVVLNFKTLRRAP